jgi:hypothetical protein
MRCPQSGGEDFFVHDTDGVLRRWPREKRLPCLEGDVQRARNEQARLRFAFLIRPPDVAEQCLAEAFGNGERQLFRGITTDRKGFGLILFAAH